jgi:hypothetical protein
MLRIRGGELIDLYISSFPTSWHVYSHETEKHAESLILVYEICGVLTKVERPAQFHV